MSIIILMVMCSGTLRTLARSTRRSLRRRPRRRWRARQQRRTPTRATSPDSHTSQSNIRQTQERAKNEVSRMIGQKNVITIVFQLFFQKKKRKKEKKKKKNLRNSKMNIENFLRELQAASVCKSSSESTLILHSFVD